MLREAVFSVYDVREDDARLRDMLDAEISQKGAYFDALRRDYPARREFYNTALKFKNCSELTRQTLLELGFTEQGGV